MRLSSVRKLLLNALWGTSRKAALQGLHSKSGLFPDLREKEKEHSKRCALLCVGADLFSRAVTSQVSSALRSLTTVFGMGTGGSSSS